MVKDSDAVDLDDSLVPFATAAAQEKRQPDNRGYCDRTQHCCVTDLVSGFVDCADQFEGLGLNVFSTDCQRTSSIQRFRQFRRPQQR